MYQCFRPDKHIIFRRRIVGPCQKREAKKWPDMYLKTNVHFFYLLFIKEEHISANEVPRKAAFLITSTNVMRMVIDKTGLFREAKQHTALQRPDDAS